MKKVASIFVILLTLVGCASPFAGGRDTLLAVEPEMLRYNWMEESYEFASPYETLRYNWEEDRYEFVR